MKILIISPSFYPATYYGGPIFSTYSFVKALAASGVKVDVITTNANGKERLNVVTGKFIEERPDLRIKYYKSLDSRSTSFGMLANLKKDMKSADIVYLVAVFSPPTPFTLYFSKKLNKPLVISPRGSLGTWGLNQGSRFKKLWLKLFISPFIKSIYWHVTSEDEEKMVKAVYPSAKTFVIPNGIDFEEFESLPADKDKSFYNKYPGYDCSDKKIIISMGRLQKVKGFDVLIEAFAELIKSSADAVLLIAGEDFGEKANLEQLIADRKLKDKVFLVSKLDGKEKLDFLHNADVFALASHHENFGMVYAEALASGTPIVASTNTPWQDAEKYGFGKWVKNTPESFAEAINQVVSIGVRKMGEIGKKYVEKNFIWENVVFKFQEICASFIQKKKYV